MGCFSSTANAPESAPPRPVTAAAPTPPAPLFPEGSSATLSQPRGQTPPHEPTEMLTREKRVTAHSPGPIRKVFSSPDGPQLWQSPDRLLPRSPQIHKSQSVQTPHLDTRPIPTNPGENDSLRGHDTHSDRLTRTPRFGGTGINSVGAANTSS